MEMEKLKNFYQLPFEAFKELEKQKNLADVAYKFNTME